MTEAELDRWVHHAMADEAAATPPGLSQQIAARALEQVQSTPEQSGGRAEVRSTGRSWVWPVLWPSAASVAVSALMGFFAGTGQLPVPLGTDLLNAIPPGYVAPNAGVDPWADTDLLAGLGGGFGFDAGLSFDPTMDGGDE
ncbi:MAG: hypothetical protein AAF213_01520 [Pseudomonadota bacterium]